MKSPLSIVKEKFGDKTKLVAAVQEFTGEDLWLGRTNEGKGLAHVSNAKLLRLHSVFTEVKGKFGTRAKLIDAILDAEKRTKDEGYKARIQAWPVPRLYDHYRSVVRRTDPSKAARSTARRAASKAAPRTAPRTTGSSSAKK